MARAVGGEVANVSHHLGVLRHARLVRDHKQGKYVIYELDPEVFHVGKAGPVVDLGCCRLELGAK